MEVKVTRKELELASTYIDSNNPKYELNYLHVDNSSMVSTNTRALVRVKHGSPKTENFNFLVDKQIVDYALKYKKSNFFVLKPNEIICTDEHDDELMIFKTKECTGKYPDYNRVLPSSFAIKIPFHHESHINGILATQKVMIEPKYIPKKLANMGELFIWHVGVNNRNLPVGITSDDGTVFFVIMPIVDNSLFGG